MTTETHAYEIPKWIDKLLSDKYIGWFIDYKFTHDGDIDWKKLPEWKRSFIPIPIIKDKDQKDELRKYRSHLTMLLKPSRETEELRTLLSHLPGSNRIPKGYFVVSLRDIVEDLGDYPIDLIREACKAYRMSTDEKYSFYPRSGQLIGYMEDEYNKRVLHMKKIKKWVDVIIETKKNKEKKEKQSADENEVQKKECQENDIDKPSPIRQEETPDNTVFL